MMSNIWENTANDFFTMLPGGCYEFMIDWGKIGVTWIIPLDETSRFGIEEMSECQIS